MGQGPGATVIAAATVFVFGTPWYVVVSGLLALVTLIVYVECRRRR